MYCGTGAGGLLKLRCASLLILYLPSEMYFRGLNMEVRNKHTHMDMCTVTSVDIPSKIKLIKSNFLKI